MIVPSGSHHKLQNYNLTLQQGRTNAEATAAVTMVTTIHHINIPSFVSESFVICNKEVQNLFGLRKVKGGMSRISCFRFVNTTFSVGPSSLAKQQPPASFRFLDNRPTPWCPSFSSSPKIHSVVELALSTLLCYISFSRNHSPRVL